jgi:hypothetical protein
MELENGDRHRAGPSREDVVRDARLHQCRRKGHRLLPGRGKFKTRYSTLGFQDAANLDDGDVWPVSYALRKWSPAVEKKVTALVRAAIS